ncbi:hypothetical protein GXB81_05805 [Paraburkholderia sp. Ac-20336]|uniref:hypothetical protein n=1 Tax=unclassified Paraburkholderia TaxID=2615204 RepID=UPI00142464FF|nr:MULTISPECIES: hypothetical protein [unclassified Paraburkholderia]MBN3802568.1 hypothetical protein [Paraburkholderia sp. Ac-20336]MBN3850537.1 hypothetical protein [Paraburkholderia sp. Ac-20342]NIF79859.1 hypothetical protein [Paraburkholderia sp. Cy-641]
MPAAAATDGHAMRTRRQAIARSAYEPVAKTISAWNTSSPMSEKNEQYQLFMSDLKQNRRPRAIPLKDRWVVIQLKANRLQERISARGFVLPYVGWPT